MTTAPPGGDDGPALPLTSRGPDEILFRRGDGEEVAGARFLRDVAALAGRLPGRRHALNLCLDRYHFLVAFAAVLVRGGVSLLSSDRSPQGLALLAARYPDSYTIGDEPDGVADLPHAPVALDGGAGGPAGAAVPAIAGGRTAAIVFTSGSTGAPVANPKPWAALVTCTGAAAERFGLDGAETASVVGTVPPQHMYGFETTVLLPLHSRASSFAGHTFFPHDVAQALARVPGPRVLVTTPLQIRALLSAGLALPAVAKVVSATAPLPAELAREAEAAWGAPVLEIFGATEVGSIASRRTLDGDVWRAYRTAGLAAAAGEGATVRVEGLPGPIRLADRVEVLGDGSTFRLLGRQTDVVKLAGKRASLAGLNAILCAVDGVEDGTFFAPDDLDRNPRARLAAFVVAPERSAGEISAALRTRVEAPFLPRPVVKVAALPRNEVGKIPRAVLAELHRRGPAGRGGG